VERDCLRWHGFRLQSAPTASLKILPKPETQIGRSAKLCIVQDLIEILELNAFVFLHGFAPTLR
jgi:hypothetical protein